MFGYSSTVKKTLAGLVGIISLTTLGCEGAVTTASRSGFEAADSAAPMESVSLAEGEQSAAIASVTDTAVPRPQLIKQAMLRIELSDVDAAVDQVSKILTRYQGDLLELSDQANSDAAPRQVWVQIRVPQNNLNRVLEDLRGLGTVQEQSITAEDASTQLVDLEARVRNLRQSEAALLGIMERSGSIADVLEVSRELSAVRENIERTDAQLKNIQNQVAYSTISMTLVSDVVPGPNPVSVEETLSLTWDAAFFTMRSLSVSLLQLLLWLLVFSPYIGLLVLGSWAGRRYWRQQHPS